MASVSDVIYVKEEPLFCSSKYDQVCSVFYMTHLYMTHLYMTHLYMTPEGPIYIIVLEEENMRGSISIFHLWKKYKISFPTSQYKVNYIGKA